MRKLATKCDIRRPDDRAAAIATEVACEYVDRCGEVSITCADGDGDDCGGGRDVLQDLRYRCADDVPQSTTEMTPTPD